MWPHVRLGHTLHLLDAIYMLFRMLSISIPARLGRPIVSRLGLQTLLLPYIQLTVLRFLALRLISRDGKRLFAMRRGAQRVSPVGPKVEGRRMGHDLDIATCQTRQR